MAAATVTHSGACHCGAVKFEFDAPPDMVAWDCNCSICLMKRNVHTMVAKDKFRFLSGEDSLTEYRFNTGVARHMFCKVCGVQAMYSPRSNPDCWAVTIYCIKPGTVRSMTIKTFDGQNWEKFFGKSGIAACSSADTAAATAAAAEAAAAEASAAKTAGRAFAAAP